MSEIEAVSGGRKPHLTGAFESDSDSSLKFASAFVVRTPLLPASSWLDWSDGLSAPRAYCRGEDLEGALRRDRAVLRQRLNRVVSKDTVTEALWLASPGLMAAIDDWRTTPDDKRGREVEHSLTRYFTRMSTRATPFGAFSGCAVGRMEASTCLELGERTGYRRLVELDADYVYGLAESIFRDSIDPHKRAVLANTTLYRIQGQFRYASSREGAAGRSYDLMSLTADPYLELVIERAGDGATLADLEEALRTTDPDLSSDEIAEYLQELVDAHVLIPRLIPPATGRPAGEALLDALRHASLDSAQLGEVQEELARIGGLPLGQAPCRYESIIERLRGLPHPPSRHVFHAQLYKSAPSMTLGPEVLRRLADALSIVRRVSGAPRDPLAEFKSRFFARYEGEWVPLEEALDAEDGIGFGASGRDASPLLAGLPLSGQAQQNPRWGPDDVWRLQLLDRVGEGEIELELHASDLDDAKRLLPAPAAVPGRRAFSTLFSAFAESEEALSRGEYTVVFDSAHGPSGANWIGRFCNGDPQIHELARNHVAAEEAGDERIFAEIAHAPEGRHANVICRPVLRQYEIPFMAQSAVPPERQIPVSDLLVSVVNGEVRLRSRKHDREVVPRLSCAHNFMGSSLAAYRFLGALPRAQEGTHLAWDWGEVLATTRRFLPRVRMGDLVLAKARWRLTRQELSQLRTQDGTASFAAVQRMKERLHLPRHISYGPLDRQLVVDLDNVLSIDAFVRETRNLEDVDVTEVYPALDSVGVRGSEGPFVAEFCVPTILEPHTPRPAPSLAGRSHRLLESAPFLVPGSSWAYLRLYAGPSSVDRIISEHIAARIADLPVERWHFVRFGDPDWHLRVRVNAQPTTLQTQVLPELLALAEHLVEDGLVWKVDVGTYRPEVSRYGGHLGMQLAERLFDADSSACAEMLAIAAAAPDPDLRWQLSLCGIATLLEDLGLDLETRLAAMDLAYTAFRDEFGGDEHLDRELGKRFRRHRPTISRLLDGTHECPVRQAALATLRRRSQVLRPIGLELQTGHEEGTVHHPVSTLAAHYVHMHANRMLRSDARAQELVIYNYLARHYRSQLARQRKQR